MMDMIAKRKLEGERTRASLIASARQVFQRGGVNGSGLDQVAGHAGVTRGAVYWHFANKAELFYAMLDHLRAALARLLDDRGAVLAGDAGDALDHLEARLKGLFRTLERDVAAREALEVLLFRCEYVGPFAAVQDAIGAAQAECLDYITVCYRRARDSGDLRTDFAPADLAVDTLHFASSLLEKWLLDRGDRSPTRIDAAIECHLELRRAPTRTPA